MPFLEACIMETLRLYPSVPLDSKNALEDDTLPDGTFVPAGVECAYSPYCFGRSVDIWGADAGEFKPERWLGTPTPSQYKYLTFNAGPRLVLELTD